ncbi:TPA: hypothetical protein ACGE8T_004225 [Klebsiella pneumoniae]
MLPIPPDCHLVLHHNGKSTPINHYVTARLSENALTYCDQKKPGDYQKFHFSVKGNKTRPSLNIQVASFKVKYLQHAEPVFFNSRLPQCPIIAPLTLKRSNLPPAFYGDNQYQSRYIVGK